MTCDLSVITCSHNPRADYLTQVLEALSEQTLDQRHWEFLLIDNASDEPLGSRVDISWHSSARHIREDKLGLTHARLRGIDEARGDLLVFVDDDNVLDADFLERAFSIAREWPRLGSWSGQTRPGFEELPAEWTKRYWGSLVIRSVDQDRWSNLPHLPETMPCGAGLCVRRDVAAYYALLHSSGKRKFVLDRAGNSLMSGGDNDLAACACDVGQGVGIFQSLKLTHLIPASRLEESYLLKLIEGIAYSAVILKSFRAADLSSYQQRWSRAVADVLRQTLMSSRERRFFRASRRGEVAAVEYLANIAKLDSGRTNRPQEQAAILDGRPVLKDS